MSLKKIVRKIVIDSLVCFGLLLPLLSDSELLSLLGSLVYYLVFIIICFSILSCLALLNASLDFTYSLIRNRENEIKSKVYKIYEPVTDICQAICLALIGHPIVGAVYVVCGLVMRECIYQSIEKHDNKNVLDIMIKKL